MDTPPCWTCLLAKWRPINAEHTRYEAQCPHKGLLRRTLPGTLLLAPDLYNEGRVWRIARQREEITTCDKCEART